MNALRAWLACHEDRCWQLAGLLALLGGWQVLAWTLHPAIIASPAATVVAMGELAASGALWRQLWITAQRLGLGLAIGAAAGLVLGIAGGLWRPVRFFLEPWRWVTSTVPAVIIAVLAMLWFGLGGRQVVFIVAILVTPTIYVNTREGMRSLDSLLVDMAAVYRFPLSMRLAHLYLPGIGSAVLAGLTLAAGTGVRAVVLAELLGAYDGLGHRFSRAWTFLNAPEMFAWIAAALGLIALLEFGLLQPLRRRLMLWRNAP